MRFIEFKSDNKTHSVRADKIIAVLENYEGHSIVCVEQFDEDSCITVAESRADVVARIEEALDPDRCKRFASIPMD